MPTADEHFIYVVYILMLHAGDLRSTTHEQDRPLPPVPIPMYHGARRLQRNSVPSAVCTRGRRGKEDTPRTCCRCVVVTALEQELACRHSPIIVG